MKTFEYRWDDSTFLLHLQLTRGQDLAAAPSGATLAREFEGGLTRRETIGVQGGEESHRFIVSRSHPKEVAFRLDYPQELVLEAFKVDDRAYYPTESFYTR